MFLGWDLLTQQLKILVCLDTLIPLQVYSVEFDTLPIGKKYGVRKGVLDLGEGCIVSPIEIWLDAIDLVLQQMKNDGFEFLKVKGICGSAQQHGSVYWKWSNEQLQDALKSTNENEPLLQKLLGAFSYNYSPNWQDHSTGKEAQIFKEAIDLPKVTGSTSHLRFTGLQIRKISRTMPEVYNDTSRISLVSSFITTLLVGDYSDLELADAGGMNLFDMNTNDWNDELLLLAASHSKIYDGVESASERDEALQEIKRKLGKIDALSSSSLYKNAGRIAPYFVSKYGFTTDCKIYPMTGDNLATILALPLQANDALVSLGTSTTVLIVTDNYNPSSNYHLFKHPTLHNHYMGMICYCNGSLAREQIRDQLLESSTWNEFNQILDSQSKFDGKLGIYFPLGEIVPTTPAKIYRRCEFDPTTGAVNMKSLWDIKNDVCGIVDSQALSCRVRLAFMLAHSKSSKSATPEIDNNPSENASDSIPYKDLVHYFPDLSIDGTKITKEMVSSHPNRCFYVGGASNNSSIIRKFGTILGPLAGNFKVEISNACALGGAYKAAWSYACEEENQLIDYNEYLEKYYKKDQYIESFDVDSLFESYSLGIGLLSVLENSITK